jgi:hypothetical protein
MKSDDIKKIFKISDEVVNLKTFSSLKVQEIKKYF